MIADDHLDGTHARAPRATISVTDLGGDGPTIVLLHGLAGSPRELLPTGRALQGYRVLLIDQRGHGRSTRRPDDLSRAASVGDVVAVMDAFAPGERCVLVGQSMGLRVARSIAQGVEGAPVLRCPGPAYPHRRRYPEDMPEITMTPEALALRELIKAHRDEFQEILDRYEATRPMLFGSVARGTAHRGSDIDILVEMDPADGNLLMRASGLMEETRALFGRDDIDVFPVQLLKRAISASALVDAVAL